MSYSKYHSQKNPITLQGGGGDKKKKKKHCQGGSCAVTPPKKPWGQKKVFGEESEILVENKHVVGLGAAGVGLDFLGFFNKHSKPNLVQHPSGTGTTAAPKGRNKGIFKKYLKHRGQQILNLIR